MPSYSCVLSARASHFASIALALAACGGSPPSSSQSPGGAEGGADDGSPTGPLAFDDFVVSYLNAYCSPRATSCPQLGVPFDEAACRKAGEASLRATYATAMTSGDTFDGVAAESCIAAVEGLTQVESNTAALVAFSQLKKACADMYTGRPKSVGKACTDDVQCQDDATSYPECSDETSGSVCSTIGLTTAAPSDGACSETAICPDGLSCSNSICARPVGLHALCNAGGGPGGVCADGLICTGDSGPDTCQAAPGPGSPCLDGIFCAPNVAYCDSSTGMCGKIPADGAPCADAAEPDECHYTSECDDGTCRPQWVGLLCLVSL